MTPNFNTIIHTVERPRPDSISDSIREITTLSRDPRIVIGKRKVTIKGPDIDLSILRSRLIRFSVEFS